MFVNDLLCGVKDMNIKITALAIILATGLPLAAQAQTPSQPGVDVQTPSQPGVDVQTPSQPGVDVQTPSQPGVDVQTPSQPGVDVQTPSQPEVDLQEQQNNFDVETPSTEPGFNVEEEESDLTPSRRTRTRRTRSSSLDSKYYAGGNLGLFAPFFGGDDGEVDPDIGIGVGGLFGYKVNKNISAELELYNARGGTDVDDLGYNIFGASANGVYRYYFDADSSKSLYAYGGLGLGFGIVSSTGDLVEDNDDNSRTGFLLGSKVGVGYPISDNIDLFGQTRYTNVFLGEEDDVEGTGEDANGLSFDVGATFNF